MMTFDIPVLGFAAYSGTGKTTLLARLIPLLKARGVRIAVIKHSHHDFDIDVPGKDSYELRKAGAGQVLIASQYREALITEKNGMDEPLLEQLVSKLDISTIDLVIVEGFRHETFPKIELYRKQMNKPFLYKSDNSIMAIATDTPLEIVALAQLDINNPDLIMQYIYDWLSAQYESRRDS